MKHLSEKHEELQIFQQNLLKQHLFCLFNGSFMYSFLKYQQNKMHDHLFCMFYKRKKSKFTLIRKKKEHGWYSPGYSWSIQITQGDNFIKYVGTKTCLQIQSWLKNSNSNFLIKIPIPTNHGQSTRHPIDCKISSWLHLAQTLHSLQKTKISKCQNLKHSINKILAQLSVFRKFWEYAF